MAHFRMAGNTWDELGASLIPENKKVLKTKNKEQNKNHLHW